MNREALPGSVPISRRKILVALGLVLCAICPGCEQDSVAEKAQPRAKDGRTADVPTGEPWFDEVADLAGVDFTHVIAITQRYYFPEIMAGGVCLLDYDNDGFLDIYFVQGGDLVASTPNRPGNRMYRNKRDGTFENATDSTGTGDNGYGMGCTCGDYDADGDVDLYVTNVGPNVLYRNNGDGTFTDVTESAGVGDPGWGTSAAFGDYDGDGHLDLFVVNYLDWSPAREIDCLSEHDHREYCSPLNYKAPSSDTLYHNRGDGTFRDVTEPAGLRQAYGTGLGITYGDFNGDDRLDYYVANDAMANYLWINGGDQTFTDEAVLAGCALNRVGVAEAGMGVAAVDVNHDGLLDLFISHLRLETNSLYLNRGTWYDEATTVMGLGAPSIGFTGFGLGFADFDHDGNLDLYVANGRVNYFEPFFDPKSVYAEPNHLFKGLSDGRFEEVSPRGGTRELLVKSSRGAAFGDLDNDGDIDVVVANNGAKPHLLRNVAGGRGNWIMFRILNRQGQHALGAAVRVQIGSKQQWRQVQRAYSYCSSSDPRVHFGLGAALRVDEVLVRWPNGTREVFGPFPARASHECREGNGRGS